jgi:DNA primase
MTRISKSQIDLVTNAQDIGFWAKKYMKLEFKGPNAFGLCPFHSEKTPSFSINTLKNFYYCFGCHKSGNSVNLVMHFESLIFHEAIFFMAQALGIVIEATDDDPLSGQYEKMAKIAQLFYSHMSKNEVAIEYLKSRQITGRSAKQFLLGLSIDQASLLIKQSMISRQELVDLGFLLPASRDPNKTYCRFRHRLMFPVQNMQGQIIGFGGRDLSNSEDAKYLNSAESKLFNKRNVLYGLYQARQSKGRTAFVVEGYIDVIRLWQNGLCGAVAPMGTAITGNQISILNRYFDQVYFCFDGDQAGINASEKALIKTLEVMRDGLRVYFVTLPLGHDPDSFILTNGVNAFNTLIERAPDLFEYLDQRYLSACQGPSDLIALALKIKPWVSEMPNSMTKRALIQFVAQKTGLGSDWLEQTVEPESPQPPAGVNPVIEKTILPNLWYNLLASARSGGVNERRKKELEAHCPIEHLPMLMLLHQPLTGQELDAFLQEHKLSMLGFSIEVFSQALINHHSLNNAMDTDNMIIQLTINYLETKINRLISRINHDSDNQQRLNLKALIHEKNSLKQQLKLNLQQGI